MQTASAFNRQFLAVRPDYVVEVRRDILEEEDGPMLLHGLKAAHNQAIILPRSQSNRPEPRLLAAIEAVSGDYRALNPGAARPPIRGDGNPAKPRGRRVAEARRS